MKSVMIPMIAVAVLAAPCVRAGDVVFKADIPFDFVVSDRHLPSGEYRIVQEHRLVKIYSQHGEQLAAAHWVPQATTGKDKASLVFYTYGTQRFLKVVGSADGSGAYLPETRAEREARSGGASTTIVAATLVP